MSFVEDKSAVVVIVCWSEDGDREIPDAADGDGLGRGLRRWTQEEAPVSFT